MIKLFNRGTNEFIGRISEGELQFLIDHLEEESLDDHDYYIRMETLEEFAHAGAPARLLEILKGGMRAENAIEVRWERDGGGA